MVAELERDASETERQQHDHERKIERRQEHAIRERKPSEQRDAGHDEPGLVPIPGRRDCVDHPIAHALIALREQQNADSKVETVEHDIECQREEQEQR